MFVVQDGIRITFVPGKQRAQETRWPGRDVARFEYEGATEGTPFEVLVDSPERMLDLIGALRTLFNEGSQRARDPR